MLPILVMSPFFITVLLLLTQKDPYFQLFDLMVDCFPHFAKQNMTRYVLLFGIRPLLLLCGCEIARVTCYTVYGLVNLWCTLFAVVKTMSRDTFYICINNLEYYKIVTLAIRYLEKCVQKLVSFGLSASFWGIVLVCWTILKFSKHLPVFIAVWLCSLVFLMIAAISMALFLIAHINDSAKAIANKLKCEKKHRYIFLKSKCTKLKAKINWKMALAIKPIAVIFEPLGHIDKALCLDYLKTLCDRVIDAVLIF